MNTRFNSAAWLIAVAAAFAVDGAFASAQDEAKQDGPSARETVQERERQDRGAEARNVHSGEFQALGDGQFRMTIDGERAHTHRLTESTKVTIDGKQATLEDLKRGDRIKVTTGENNVALMIQAVRGNRRDGDARRRPARQGATLGVRLGPSPTTGVLIRDVHPRGDAAQAGLQSGDYILEINDRQIESDEDFDEALSQLKMGDRARLTIWRDRKKRQIDVAFTEERQAAIRPQNDEENQSSDGWLGVLLEDADENERGVRIARIYPSGPAARAGLERGDVLVQVTGKQVASADKAAELISQTGPNEQIELVVIRDGERETFEATLADRRAFFQQNAQSSRDRNRRGFRDFDDAEVIPEHSMMLEQHRRFAEQHERIERKLDDVLDELEALRKQLGRERGNGDRRQ